MIDQKDEFSTRAERGERLKSGTTWSFVGWVLLASVVAGVPGCDRNQSKLDEAVEEVEDEAKDTKDEIKDEIDDHT